MLLIANPFRPGAGHRPPYLAGRQLETDEFAKLLRQDVILENMVLTGLRGVGKTVLLETFKPSAIEAGWHWVGTDLSESSSLSEDAIALRLLTDLSVVTSRLSLGEHEVRGMGFLGQPANVALTLDFDTLRQIFINTPGLPSDKLKAVLEVVWGALEGSSTRGIIFAYDEAQTLADHAKKEQFPLSLLLEVFQSLQRKNMRFMLVLVGLPTLFPKLVEARTYAERMFRVVFLDRLSEAESRQAILKPIEEANCPVSMDEESIQRIIHMSAGYPYLIQYICREVFDAFVQGQNAVPEQQILRKLDSDFFAGRWARATDRQRDLLRIIAQLTHSESEFTVQAIVNRSKLEETKPFSASHVNQMLGSLADAGLIYKNRHGKYSLAVPLLDQFIRREVEESKNNPGLSHLL